MKKYSFIVAALLLAVAFSAFTPVKEKSKTPETLYYFWHNGVTAGSQVDDEKMDHDEAVEATCPEGASTVCARGYEFAENPDSPENPSLDEIKRILAP